MVNKKIFVSDTEYVNDWSDKNTMKPDMLTIGSKTKVWWIGKCGHEWKATVKNHCKNHSGCPYCVNRAVLKGYNDLAYKCPNVAEEWSDRNGALKPDEVVYRSFLSVWWRCRWGHEWKAVIYYRAKGDGCPVCKSEKEEGIFRIDYINLSYEKKIGFLLQYLANRYRIQVYVNDDLKVGILFPYYFPSYNFAVDIVAEQRLTDRRREWERKRECIFKEKQISLIRVMIHNRDYYKSDVFLYLNEKTDRGVHELVHDIFLVMGIDLEIDSHTDWKLVCSELGYYV